MKKAFESWKIWTILSALIFIMTCGLVVFAWYTTVSNTSHFDDWSTEKLSHTNNGNPILTWWDWDSIINSLNGLVIPKWAIMAFELATCPNGWSPYNKANNRFLMWADNNIGYKSWSFRVTLTWDQLPKHSHYFEDTVILEEAKYYWITDAARNYSWYIRKDVQMTPIRGNSQLANNTNFLTVVRKTSDFFTTSGGPKGGAIRWQQYEDVDYKNWVNYYQKNIDITNPYIKVLYCIKD